MRSSHLGSMVIFLLLTACGGGGGGGSTVTPDGSLTVGVSDGPVEQASEVVVAFTGVSVQPQSGNAQTFELDDTAQINLLDYQNGERALLLDGETVTPGDYNWIRLEVLEADSYVIVEGQQFPLEVPSGEQSGLQLNRGFTVAAGSLTDFTIEFDLRKSLTVTGNGRYILRPTLRIVDTLETGSIEGTVASALVNDPACNNGVNNETGNAVYLFQPDDAEIQDIRGNDADPLATATVEFVASSSEYRFTFGFVAPGDYVAAFTCDALLDDPEVDDSETVVFSDPVGLTVEVDTATEIVID